MPKKTELDKAWEKLNKISRAYNRNPTEANEKALERAQQEYNSIANKKDS
jgi:hypothetical protein